MTDWRNHTRTAQRSLWHGRLKPMLEDDATWEPTYRSLVAAVLAVWITAMLIGAAAWAQFAFPAASQPSPRAVGTTSPAVVEAAAGDTGDRL